MKFGKELHCYSSYVELDWDGSVYYQPFPDLWKGRKAIENYGYSAVRERNTKVIYQVNGIYQVKKLSSKQLALLFIFIQLKNRMDEKRLW